MNTISRSSSSSKNQSNTSTISKSLTETSHVTTPTHLLPGYQGTTTSKLPIGSWTPPNANRTHVCTQASPQPAMVRVFHSGVAIDYHQSPQITSVLWPIYKDNGELSVVAQDGPWRGTPSAITTGATSYATPASLGPTRGRIVNEPKDKAVSQQKQPLDGPINTSELQNVPNGPPEQPKMLSAEDTHEGKKKMDSLQILERRQGTQDNFKRVNTNVLESLARKSSNAKSMQTGSDMQLEEATNDNSNIKIASVKVQGNKAVCIKNFESSKKCEKVGGISQAKNCRFEKQNADARNDPKETTSSAVNTPQGVYKIVKAQRGNNMQTSQELELAVTSEGSSNRRPAQLMCDRKDAQETVKDLIVRIREIQGRLLHTESEDRKKRMLKVIVLLHRKIKALTEEKKKAKTGAAKQQRPLHDSSSPLLKEPIKEETTDSNKNPSEGSIDSHPRNCNAASAQTTTSGTLEVVGHPDETTETTSEVEEKRSGNNSAFYITESQKACADPTFHHPVTDQEEACGNDTAAAVEIKSESLCYVHRENRDENQDCQVTKTGSDDCDKSGSGQCKFTRVGRLDVDSYHSSSTDSGIQGITMNKNAPLNVEQATQNEDTVAPDFGYSTPGEEQVIPLEDDINPTKGKAAQKESRDITKDGKDLTSHVINTTQNETNAPQRERDVRNVTLGDQESSCLAYGEGVQDELRTQEENIASENLGGEDQSFGSLHDFSQASVSNMTGNNGTERPSDNFTRFPELNSSPQNMMDDSTEGPSDNLTQFPELDSSPTENMGDSSLDMSDEGSRILTAGEPFCNALWHRNSIDIDLQGFTSPSIYNPSGRSEDVDLAQSLQIREARILKLRQMKERILANVSRITRYADHRMQNI